MTKEELFKKASGLPFVPGVYIIRGRSGAVIYVGKSKVLRQRVSQYFAPSGKHDIKTQSMADAAADFEYMITDTEMEALALENRLIKLHKPKFNIKLKDGKSYPYIKVTMNEEYPRLLAVRARENDRARYYGPYTSISAVYNVIKTAQRTFKISGCAKQFPRDIGKERPCLYHRLGQCIAPCSGNITSEQYREQFKYVNAFLRGSYGDIKKSLEGEMEYAAENLMFEAAALCRDKIRSLDVLQSKQNILGGPEDDIDVFSLYTDERCSCLAVFYVRMGFAVDSEHFIFPAEQIADGETLSSFIGELYNKRGYIPDEILFGFPLDDDSFDMLHDYLRGLGGRPAMKIPERGDKKALCGIVWENAKNQAERYLAETERDNKMLYRLAQLLSLEVVPQRIEAYDVSNMGDDSIVCGMIVACDGKLKKNEYRLFNISAEKTQDDYAAMSEAIERRMGHENWKKPDLILLDGGKGHVSTIRALLCRMNINIPVYGMVKDEYHKTRGLTSDAEDISIAREQSVFNFVYKLQEEVHRYSVTCMSDARSRALKKSSLEEIKGIGPAKARALLSHFKNIAAIAAADADKLLEINMLSKSDAGNIIEYFAKNKLDENKKVNKKPKPRKQLKKMKPEDVK